MRFIGLILIASTLVFTAIAANAADTATVHVTAGKTTTIRSFATWHHNCTPDAVPWVTITKKPSHGTLDTGLNDFKIHEILYGDTKCIGRTVKGVFLYYTPIKSYRGPDSIEYYVDYSKAQRHEYIANIDVK